MRKFILIFILSILFISFLAFFYNVYILQKNYFNSKQIDIPNELINDAIVPSVYINYSKEEYDKALLENRITVLFFTSNWCMKCNDQDTINSEVFDSLNKEGVVGLKIHILDSETTTETDALSRKFDIIKENSLVILDKKGAVSFKYVGEMTAEILKDIIMKAGDI